MSAWLVLVITTALIVLSGFFVVIEFALMGARRHRLEAEAPSRASARAALRGMNQLTMMLAAAQLGITACTFALGAVTKPAIDHWLHPVLISWGLPAWLSGGAAFAASLLLVTFLHLVVGEMAPKSWAIAHPELAARIIGIPSRVFVWPLRPFLTWVNAIANALVARTGVAPVDRAAVGGRDADTIRQLVEHSAATGALEPDLQEQISEAIRLKDLAAGHIRTGAKAPTSAPADATVSDVQRATRDSGHLRVLLQDRNGEYSRVVHVRDTLMSSTDRLAEDFARPVLRASEDEPVYELLRRMRDSRVQLALVTGEGGSGVVTMKDMIQRVLPAGRRQPS